MLDEKELIEIAQSEGETIENLINDGTTVVKFIKYFDLVPGEVLVPNFLIYYVYKSQWSIQGNKVKKIDFMRRFSKVFEQKRTTKVRYYKLNHNPFDCYDTEVAKRYDKKYNKTKKDKKKSV